MTNRPRDVSSNASTRTTWSPPLGSRAMMSESLLAGLRSSFVSISVRFGSSSDAMGSMPSLPSTLMRTSSPAAPSKRNWRTSSTSSIVASTESP